MNHHTPHTHTQTQTHYSNDDLTYYLQLHISSLTYRFFVLQMFIWFAEYVYCIYFRFLFDFFRLICARRRLLCVCEPHTIQITAPQTCIFNSYPIYGQLITINFVTLIWETSKRNNNIFISRLACESNFNSVATCGVWLWPRSYNILKFYNLFMGREMWRLKNLHTTKYVYQIEIFWFYQWIEILIMIILILKYVMNSR